MEETNTYSLPEGKVLALKILYANGQSYHNKFQYPGVGHTVSAPDWMPSEDCGQGLHGYLWGHGDITVSLYNPGELLLYQVHEVGEYISLTGKIKYPSALVVEEFDSIIDALNFIEYHTPEKFRSDDDKVLEIIDNSKSYRCIQDSQRPSIQLGNINAIQVSEEDSSMQSANAYSIQITRNLGYQRAGSRSMQVGVDNVKQFAYTSSIQRASYRATQTSKDNCIQEAGNYSLQTAGDSSIQKSGARSRLSAGVNSIQYAAEGSMCRAGLDSHIFIQYQCKLRLKKFAHGFVDGKKLKANTWYKVEHITGKFYEVDHEGNRLPSLLSTWKAKILNRLSNLKELLW